MPIAMSKMLVQTNLGVGWTVLILGFVIGKYGIRDATSERNFSPEQLQTQVFPNTHVVKASRPHR